MPSVVCSSPAHRECRACLRRMCQVAPLEEWPNEMVKLLLGTRTIECRERVKLACFLYGNGSNADDIRTMLRHRLRDKAAARHLEEILGALRSGGDKFFYFSVRDSEFLYMDGRPKRSEGGRCSLASRINSWDRYVRTGRRTPLAHQVAFLSQSDCNDAEVFVHLHFGKPLLPAQRL